MSVEIEAKMRLTDADGLRDRLIARSAQPGREVFETNTFFDTADGSLRRSNQGLRIRVEQDLRDQGRTVIVTHKGPREPGQIKRRREHEVIVEDADHMADILHALGFQAMFYFEKRRQYWGLDGCDITIDTLPYLGNFVEIEGPSNECVLSTRRALGLEVEPMIPASYLALLTEYAHERSLQCDDFRFDT